MTPLFNIQGFEEMSEQEQLFTLEVLLNSLVMINVIWLQSHSAPLLYDLKPRYVIKSRPFAIDSWQDICSTIKLGSGDCKDFAAYRCAELMVRGFDSTIKAVKNGEIFHFLVRNGNFFEDPSEKLGMQQSLMIALGLS